MRSFKNGCGGNFTVDVVMKGSQEECQGFMIEASLIDVKSGKDELALKATFPPRPLKKENMEGFCLSVPQEVLTGIGEYITEREAFFITYHIKIVKRG